MLPAQSPGRPRGPASCTCASGATGPPSPAALVSRLTVTIATLRLPPALDASPGLELAVKSSQPRWPLLFPEQHEEGRGDGRGARGPPPHTRPPRRGCPAKPPLGMVFRDPHRPHLCTSASSPWQRGAVQDGGGWEAGDLGSKLYFLVVLHLRASLSSPVN